MKDGPARVDIPLFLASSFVRLGRIEEAQAEVRRALLFDRSMSQAKWRERYIYSDKTILERQLVDLSTAGLPEK
jgi:hypothetical protein